MTQPLQDPISRLPFSRSFEKLIRSATAAFEAGARTFELPWQFEWDPPEWNADQVRLARLLLRSPEHDAIGRDYVDDRGYPPEPGCEHVLSPETLETYRAWAVSLEELLRDVHLRVVDGPADFQLTTEITNYACWVTVYVVLPVTDRVGVLTVDGLADTWLPYPVPVALVDRARLLPSLAEALGETDHVWPTDLSHLSAECTHSARDLHRVILAPEVGESVWEMSDAELRELRLTGAEWGYHDLEEQLARGTIHFHLTEARGPTVYAPRVANDAPARRTKGFSALEYAEFVPGQVGCLCFFRATGRFALCHECGSQHRPRQEFGSRGSSEPLLIDSIRPQPQRCARCGEVLVKGIVDGLPERYPRYR